MQNLLIFSSLTWIWFTSFFSVFTFDIVVVVVVWEGRKCEFMCFMLKFFHWLDDVVRVGVILIEIEYVAAWQVTTEHHSCQKIYKQSSTLRCLAETSVGLDLISTKVQFNSNWIESFCMDMIQKSFLKTFVFFSLLSASSLMLLFIHIHTLPDVYFILFSSTFCLLSVSFFLWCIWRKNAVLGQSVKKVFFYIFW